MNRPLIIGGTAIILVLISGAIYQTLTMAGNGTLHLVVSPEQAKVTIDGRITTKPGQISLTPGSHSVKVEQPGFTSQTVTIQITGGQTTEEGVVLATPPGAKPSQDTRSEQQIAADDGAASQAVQIEGAKITTANPLIAKLPYYGPDYNIDVGVSQAHPSDREAVALTLATPTKPPRPMLSPGLRPKASILMPTRLFTNCRRTSHEPYR